MNNNSLKAHEKLFFLITRILKIFSLTICHILIFFSSDSTIASQNDNLNQNSPNIQIADHFYDDLNYDSAIVYYKIASHVMEQEQKWTKYTDCLVNISKSYLELNNFDSAFFYAKRANGILISKLNNDLIIAAEIDYLLGTIHGRNGEIDLSENFYFCALEKCREVQYDSLEAVIGKAIGNVSFSKGNYDKALQYYQDALNVEKSRSNPSDLLIASLIQNVGIIYSLIGKYELAGEFFERSMVLKEKLLENDDPHLANVYINFGRFQTVLGNNQEGFVLFRQSREDFSTQPLGLNIPDLPQFFLIKGQYTLLIVIMIKHWIIMRRRLSCIVKCEKLMTIFLDPYI
ncbi:MAG: tetratricopeptide repeat protein [Bacteroidales bacterium]